MDSKAFHDFEHAGWQEIPRRYHEAFANLTTQAIGPLLDAVSAEGGARLLDVASGPGYVAAAATERGTEVVGVDFSAAMVREARVRYPGIELQEGDAEELPFPDNTFDAAVINFGMLHLARPDQALAEARRVLRPGGKFAFTVWAKPAEAKGFGIVLGAIETYGDLNVPLPPGPRSFVSASQGNARRLCLGPDLHRQKSCPLLRYGACLPLPHSLSTCSTARYELPLSCARKNPRLWIRFVNLFARAHCLTKRPTELNYRCQRC